MRILEKLCFWRHKLRPIELRILEEMCQYLNKAAGTRELVKIKLP
jgi:DNA-binding Xre family transcriptional regulator